MDDSSQVSVETLFRDMAEQLGLQWLAGRSGGHRTLSSETIQKPTLALIGHLNFVHPNRVQVLGCAEMDYLRSLSQAGLEEAIQHLFSSELAAIIVSNGEAVPAALLENAERSGTPLLASGLASPILMSYLGHYLTQRLAECSSLHGVFLEVLGTGVLLTGDILQVVQDRRYVSFMRSYPNLIPLPAAMVQRVVGAVEPFAYDRIYGAWWDTIIPTNAKAGVQYSAERYVRALQGEFLHATRV